MLIAICITILVYSIMGKDIHSLLEEVKGVDWKGKGKMSDVMESLKPYALRVGRTAARPLLQFWFVMGDERTSALDKVLIYAALIYTVSPVSLIPSSVYKLLGVLDEGAAVAYVYKKVKDNITPEIHRKVEDVLTAWFGLDCERVL